MAGFIESINGTFRYINHDLADSRTANWWGISNPFIILSIISSYLYFCKSLGPRLMKDRPPFQLKNVLLVYNFLQVLLSLYLMYLGTIIIFDKEYSIACENLDYSDNPRALLKAGSTWWYFFAKVTELLDTIFFVLRKKYNQVSFLHVYHHTIMATLTWYGVKYIAGGHVVVMGYLNSIVHVIMYTYYLISGLGPEYQKYIWWKKHVTLIQLIQFCIIFVHNFIPLLNFYECGYPKTLNLMLCCNATAFIYMFGNFYVQNYKRENKLNMASSEKNKPATNILAEKVRKTEARQRNVAEKTR